MQYYDDERITALNAAETELERMQALFRNINYQMRDVAGVSRYDAFSQIAALEQFPDHIAPLIAQKQDLSKRIRNQIWQVRQLSAAFTMHELLTITLFFYHSSSHHHPYHSLFYSVSNTRLYDMCHVLEHTLYPLFHNNDYEALAHYDYPTIIQDLMDYRDIVGANKYFFPNRRYMEDIPQALAGYREIQEAVILHAEDLKNKARAFIKICQQPTPHLRASAPIIARLSPDLLQHIADQTLLPSSLNTTNPSFPPKKLPWL